MSINDRKIGAWANPVVNEETRPNRTPAAMKAIFDANTNELKDALNGAIDDLRAGDVDVTFSEAAERAGLESGDTHATLFGKIKKWLADLTPAVQTIKTDQGVYRFLRGDGEYAVPEVGEAYNGVPSGGTAGQVLVKNSGADFDSSWKALTRAWNRTLTAGGWSDGVQDLVLPISTENVVLVYGVSEEYARAIKRISVTHIAEGLRFTTNNAPTDDIDLNIVAMQASQEGGIQIP